MTKDYSISRRETLLGSLGLAAAAGMLIPSTSVLAQQAKRWGSSSIGSTGYVIIEALASTVNKHTKLKNSSMATSGGAENMALIGEGQLEFCQTTSTDWQPAVNGEKPYGKKIDVNQVLAYTVFNCTPMVRADSPIKTLADLEGKRCMPSPAGSSTAAMWRVLFEAAGVKVNWTYGSWRESYDALRAGAVDCIPSLFTNSRPAPILTELEATTPVRILPVPEDVMKKAQAINPGVVSGELNPTDWKTIDKPMNVASFSGILACHPKMSEQDVYDVCKAIFENAAEVQSIGKQLKDIDAKFGARYLMTGFKVHPGAAKYFKEKGIWRDELTIAS
jgi:uncharacterized protein